MATTTTAASQTYLRNRLLSASPAELRLMLIDGAIRFTAQARAGYESRDYESAYDGTTKAQAILMELMNALRPDQAPELCQRLSALYTYMYSNLVKASSTREIALLDEVLTLLRYDRETWELCMDELSRENRASSRLAALPAVPAPHAGAGAPSRLSVQG
jgi:flagellar protein FliS